MFKVSWKEMWWSLAAGNALVPFGDNDVVVRRLSERIAELRDAEAAKNSVSASAPSLASGRPRRSVSVV